MEFLTIDPGSYSVKFLHYTVDKKSLYIQDFVSVNVEEVMSTIDFDEENEFQKVEITQAQIIKDYLDRGFEGKVISYIPPHLVTARYFELPVTSPKKVEMMLPFQLDDNLPFAASEAHFVASYKKLSKSTYAVVNISQKATFHQYFNLLERYQALPHILTSDISAINSFSDQYSLRETYAFLDIGHRYSRFFVTHDKSLLTHHSSHVAGSIIDEVISSTYQISLPEAVAYKHENCFFLTKDQVDSVSEEQQEFAKLMSQAISPLMQDLKRWLLGFRVKYGISIDQIYLTGGSANIANISHYLSEELDVNVNFLDLSDDYQDPDQILDGNENIAQSSLVGAIASKSRIKPANFLTGNYSQGSSHQLPLHSTFFISVRVAMIAIFCSFFLMFEVATLSKQTRKLSRGIKKSISNPHLGLTKVQVNRFRRSPKRLINLLKGKKREVEQEIKTIQAAARVDALTPLAKVIQIIGPSEEGELLSFNSKDGLTNAIYKTKDSDRMKAISERLERSGLNSLTLKKRDKEQLEITFTD